MNSLSYLARQFDVLASPRAPPSTPVLEKDAFLSDRRSRHGAPSDESLKRVRTWSTKSLLFPPPAVSSPLPLKRSYSSPPGGFITITPVRRSSHRLSVSNRSLETPIRPKSNFQSVVRRVFFVRVFVLLWNTVCSTWASLTRRRVESAVHGTVAEVEVATVSDDKETETETEDEKPVLLPESEPPLQPRILSIPSPTSSNIPGIIRLHTDPPLLHDATSKSIPVVSGPLAASASLQPLPTAPNASRSPTPILTARKTPFHLPKTLVLDLDETLIHSTSRPISSSGSNGSGLLGLGGFGRRNKGAGHMVEVVLRGQSTLYHVYKRPFVDYFLRKVSGWYTLVIFTASMQEYADPVIDWLDAGRGILARRFFRESCTQLPNGSYTKNLSIVEPDLSRVCLIDNSPISYRVNEANGIPIEGWTHDPSDEALLALLPVLDSLRFTSDVRRVLGIRGFS